MPGVGGGPVRELRRVLCSESALARDVCPGDRLLFGFGAGAIGPEVLLDRGELGLERRSGDGSSDRASAGR